MSEPNSERFRDHLTDSKQRVLEPIDPTVNYSFEVVDVDPWTLELNANKWWLSDDGQVKQASRSLQIYELPPHEIEREIEREGAAMDREDLEFVHRTEGLQASMHEAEMLAVRSGYLDSERDDARLFTQGPSDRFTTLREAELAGQEREVGIPDDWEALLDHPSGYEPESPAHYWQMQHRPAQTADGQPLGVALFVTEFPELPPDFDAYVDLHGMDDSLYPSQARTLEMAHFADEADARKFEAEFRSYLIPGLLDGPELAPEVAKLEGLSGNWQAMTERDILDSMSGNRTIIRDLTDWHLHNPNAEREAREGYESASGEIGL